MVKLHVDNVEIEAIDGTTLLQACLQNDIHIPNLCYLERMTNPHASCRLCFVEIEGENSPVTSCTVEVKDGMVVRTNTDAVRRLQRTALQFLLSVHDVDCGNCPANKKCELQRTAKLLKVGLKPKNLEQHLKETAPDDIHPLIEYYPNRCVLCGKCIFVCQEKHGQPIMTFAKRGFETVISFYGEKDVSALPCEECCSCVEICPVSAIVLKSSLHESQVT